MSLVISLLIGGVIGLVVFWMVFEDQLQENPERMPFEELVARTIVLAIVAWAFHALTAPGG